MELLLWNEKWSIELLIIYMTPSNVGVLLAWQALN